MNNMSHIDRAWLREKLMSKSTQVSESGCILWTGAMSSNGYGSLRINWKGYSTHRLSYYAHNGEVEDGMSVLHSCDVRCCINPDHLRAGTYSDNQRDRLIRGRHHKTDLLPEDVIQIKSALKKHTFRQVAEMFNLSMATVYQINSGSSWRWIGDDK